MSESGRLREGQIFGRYQIVRLIGEGGMGAVYEAIHPVLKKRFAVKTLLPAIAQKEEARVRFLREAEAASSINHPNIVDVSDVGTADEIPYLVMELLEGQSLGEYLAERGCLRIEDAMGLLLPVISAVSTGHDRGVIHRDLKPQNIFLARGPWGESIPKVLDFGVSKLTGDDNAVITRTLTVLGTAAYMSPEQARGARHVGFPSDQYALGLILYEMLTGCRAHAGENSLEILHNVASAVIRPIRELKPDLPPDLESVVNRMLAPSPAGRFPSLRDVGRVLLPFAGDRTRMALTNAFNDSANDLGKTVRSPDARDGARVATAPGLSERSDSPSGSGVGGTQRLPTPVVVEDLTKDPSDTTLRQAAGEAARRDGAVRRSSVSKMAAAATAVLVVAVVAGAVIWTTRKLDATATSSAPRAAPLERGAAAAPTTARGTAAPAALPTGSATAPTEIAPASGPRLLPTIPFEIMVVPPEAEIGLDDRPPIRGRLEIVLPLPGSSHEIRVSAPGYLPKVISFGSEDQPPSEIRLDRKPAAALTGVSERSAARSSETSDGRSPAAKVQRAPVQRAAPAKFGKAIEPATRGEVGSMPKRGSNNALIIK